jgi:hypothetical protein
MEIPDSYDQCEPGINMKLARSVPKFRILSFDINLSNNTMVL